MYRLQYIKENRIGKIGSFLPRSFVLGFVVSTLFLGHQAAAATMVSNAILPQVTRHAPAAETYEEFDISAQTALYKQTLSAINKGHKSNTRTGLQKLKDHPLHPYLLGRELSRRLRQLPFQDVDQFLSDNINTVAGKQLHQKWLLVLAQKKQWKDFNRYYDARIAGNELKCLRLEALNATGFTQLALDQTSTQWLNKKSMPDACDSVFKRWENAGMKTDNLVWDRIQLALNAKNKLLARYLTKRSSAVLKPFARRLIDVHNNPLRLKKRSDFSDDSLYTVDIITHGLKRLAARNNLLADTLWLGYRGSHQFSDQQLSSIRNKIARQVIASGHDNALDWLISNDPNADDSYLLEWRIRLALKKQKWSQARLWISMLPPELENSPRWRYWLARCYQQQNDDSAPARHLLEQLATERNYYGFLSADLIDLSYDFNHFTATTTTDKNTISNNGAIRRAYAFYIQNNLLAARREWFSAIENFDRQQLIAATEIVHQWGWHQQAIMTTIKADAWNDLDIRFPLAFESSMISSASSATIKPEWLYAIARQESSFAIDAYSSAGARGLLQLMPRTARQIAKKMGLKFAANDLYLAEKNITLGSSYLKQLLHDFQGNHVLATAAYNAGPHRVKRWLNRQNNALPYDIWIETLPYHETRNYVQNVLAFSVIYGYRLGFDSSIINNVGLMIGERK
ncbi:MAG: soluble lytic murein transglycosylase [Gammaproteobacteria bacterium]